MTLAGGASSESVTVTYQVTGTATPEEDYRPSSGTLTIPAESATGTFAVTTTADGVLEGDETMVVTLVEASTGGESAAVGARSTVVTTIQDGDGAVTVSLEDPVTVVEGEPMTFTVILSGPVSADVTLEYSTRGRHRDGK